MKTNFAVPFLLGGLGLLSACGGGAPSPPPPQPSVTLSASTPSVVVGQTVTLIWSTENASACTASASPVEADWSGSLGLSGSKAVSPVAGQTTYTLACMGAGGTGSKAAAVQGIVPTAITITSPNTKSGIAGLAFGDLQTIMVSGQRLTGEFFALAASGGSGAYQWSMTAAKGSTIPDGISCCSALLCAPFPSQQCVRADNAISGRPKTTGTYHVVITATDSAGGSGTQDFAINVQPPLINAAPSPAIGTLNSPFVGYGFTATGGVTPLTWSESGALPKGLAFDTNGLLSGTPTEAGSFPVTVSMQDGAGNTAAPKTFTLMVLTKGFTQTGSMKEARWLHTATLLPSGKVLVAGGSGLATAELYDPATGVFGSTGTMQSARDGGTATLLNTGQVLMVGGMDATGIVVATAELYDPATGTFSSSGSMKDAREYHTATLLSDGRVLVTGGYGPQNIELATAEIYDPASNGFSAAGDMAFARATHTAVLLGDNKVLVTGEITAAAELFDPQTNAFSGTGTAPKSARSYATLTLLANGKALLCGGESKGGLLATAELYDPSSATFSPTTNMEFAHSRYAAALLSNGKVLVVGGANKNGSISAVELFDAVTNTFSRTADMTTTRSGHTATVLTNGKVLIVGGIDSTLTAQATAELYDF